VIIQDGLRCGFAERGTAKLAMREPLRLLDLSLSSLERYLREALSLPALPCSSFRFSSPPSQAERQTGRFLLLGYQEGRSVHPVILKDACAASFSRRVFRPVTKNENVTAEKKVGTEGNVTCHPSTEGVLQNGGNEAASNDVDAMPKDILEL